MLRRSTSRDSVANILVWKVNMSSKTAEELYEDLVRPLPLKERLRLAALILNEVIPTLSTSKVDDGEAWSNEDIRDLTLTSLWYATQSEQEN